MRIVVIENPRPLTVEHYNDVANAPLSASLNSGYALAVARHAGWEASYLDFTRSDADAGTLAGRVLSVGADLVLIHWVYSWGDEGRVAELIRNLKEEGGPLVGAFGLFPTLACAKLAAFAQGVDFLVVGEFEESMRELLVTVGKGGRLIPIPGVYLPGLPFKAREVIGDISLLPVPDDVGINAGLGTLNVAASRGCFGDCGFCFIPSFYGCGGRRVRTAESFERELQERLDRRQCSRVYFIDPTFLGLGEREGARVRRIGTILGERGVTFGFECRADTVRPELLQSLAGDGATDVFLGVESGCDAALRRMNKKVDKRTISRAVNEVQRVGLNLHAGFIMFEPDTTIEELEENFAFLEDHGLLSDPDRTVNLLYHSQIVLYGSTSWKRFEKEGRLLQEEHLPFEASFTFRDPDVARICAGMKEVATKYFLESARRAQRRDDGCGGRDDRTGENEYLKESFLRLIRSVRGMSEKQFQRLTAG